MTEYTTNPEQERESPTMQRHIGIKENIHCMLYLFAQNHYRFTILVAKMGLYPKEKGVEVISLED